MFRTVLALVVGFAALSLVAFAEDKKADKKTFEGMLVCAKCTLKDADKCTNALKVKDGGKEVVYLLKDQGAKEEYHKMICAADKEAKVKVSGKVVEKDGKKWLEDVKVEVLK